MDVQGAVIAKVRVASKEDRHRFCYSRGQSSCNNRTLVKDTAAQL
jgi:hypothetical protein